MRHVRMHMRMHIYACVLCTCIFIDLMARIVQEGMSCQMKHTYFNCIICVRIPNSVSISIV